MMREQSQSDPTAKEPAMAIPVVQLGTGNVGVHSLRALIADPEFELTGVWVSSDAKAGKDAAELAGLADSTGVRASTDLNAVLATGPRCAVYNAMADNRLPGRWKTTAESWRQGSISSAAARCSCNIRGR